MKRFLVLATAMASMVLVVPVASAAPPTMSITGGATAIQPASGGDIVRTVGFNAIQDSAGDWKGQVQIKDLTTTGTLLAQFHGRVTCAQETTSVAAGGQGWEIRFLVTKGKGSFGFLEGSHQSIYIQDDDISGDQLDFPINFAGAACGLSDDVVVWDAVVQGSIAVHA